jgi:hypothetical protein
MSRRSLRTALLSASFAALLLAGCGGGGGGGGDQAEESTPRLLAFNAESQVAGAYEPTASNAGFVFMRDADSGRVNKLVMRLRDGTLVTLYADARGRLTRIATGNERITVTGYTATTAKVTYFKGGTEVGSETVSLSTGAAVASSLKSQGLPPRLVRKAASTEDASAPLLQQRSDFIRDIGRFAESILRLARETLAEKIREVGSELEASESEPVSRLGTKLSCVDLTPTECAPEAIERLPGLTHKIHFGLSDYNEKDLEILRDKDDIVPAASTPTEPTEPTEPTKPTEPTEPTQPTEPTEPEEPVGLAAHDLMIETWVDTAITEGLPYSGAEAFALVSAPKNGTVSRLDTTTGTFTYTPNPGFAGTDTFKFVVSRKTATGTQTSAPGLVTITVQERPGLPGTWEVRSGGKVLGTVSGSKVPTSKGAVTSAIYGEWLRQAIENQHLAGAGIATASTSGSGPTYTSTVTYKPGWWSPDMKDSVTEQVKGVIVYNGCGTCGVNTGVSYEIDVEMESIYKSLAPSTIRFPVYYTRKS